jgi:hypothetical protein
VTKVAILAAGNSPVALELRQHHLLQIAREGVTLLPMEAELGILDQLGSKVRVEPENAERNATALWGCCRMQEGGPRLTSIVTCINSFNSLVSSSWPKRQNL